MAFEPVFYFLKCGGGAQWTEPRPLLTKRICDFSGCGCNTQVKQVTTSPDRKKAAAWFRKPIKLPEFKGHIYVTGYNLRDYYTLDYRYYLTSRRF